MQHKAEMKFNYMLKREEGKEDIIRNCENGCLIKTFKPENPLGQNRFIEKKYTPKKTRCVKSKQITEIEEPRSVVDGIFLSV